MIAEEVDIFEKGRLVGLIRSIMKSDLWKRVLAAEKKYFEVPFSVKTDTEALPQALRSEGLSGHAVRKEGEEVVVNGEGEEDGKKKVDKGDGKEDKGNGQKGAGDGNTDEKDGNGKEGKRRGSEGRNAENLQIILTGAIDLVFWEEDGWVIADYKTDEVDAGPKLQNFIDYYSPQVKIYSKFWEQITGQKVKESGLYFTSINKWIEIKFSCLRQSVFPEKS